MTKHNMEKITFGPVYVASKRMSKSGNSYTIVLRQNTVTTIGALENNRFALAHTNNNVATSREVESKRTNTQTVPLEDGHLYPEGKEVGGHIQRITWPYPQYEGHVPAYEGGFCLTKWNSEFLKDEDLRPITKEGLLENEKAISN